MLKRILMLMMALLLLLPLHAAGEEELYDRIDEALCLIVQRTEAGDTPIGSGALFGDASTVLTAACCQEGALYAVTPDGEYAVTGSRPLGCGAALLTLASPAGDAPLTLAPTDAQSLPFIFGVNDGGERGTMPLYNARAGLQEGLITVVLDSEEGLLPGAFLTDEEGRFTALVTSQQAEGLGSYNALGIHALSQLLTGETADDSLLDFTLSWEDGVLTIAWTDEERTEGLYVITLVNRYNNYYTTYEAELSERSLTLTPPPGHSYAVQVQHAASEAEALPPDWVRILEYTLPMLPFQAYGFEAECSVISVPAGTEATGEEAPVTAFTPAALTDKGQDLLLNVHSSYTVSAETTATLTVELLAPDGQFFFDEKFIDLYPDTAADDRFVLPLDELLASCLKFSGGAAQEGEYTVRFFLDGCKAGEAAFTVTAQGEAASPAPAPAAPATAGFAAILSLESSSGLATVTWDTESIPAGAAVRVYTLQAGNPYFNYLEAEEGQSSAQVFVVPGRQMLVWAAWSTEETFAHVMPDLSIPAQYRILEEIALTPLTAHGFRNVRIGLAASADPAAASSTDFLPQTPITREMLSDRATPIYFMTEDTYQVGATTEDHPLLIVLTTPEGMCFTDIGMYIFDRSLQASDLWKKDVSAIFEAYESFAGDAAWPAGEYSILYCIDGQLAGEINFTLE